MARDGYFYSQKTLPLQTVEFCAVFGIDPVKLKPQTHATPQGRRRRRRPWGEWGAFGLYGRCQWKMDFAFLMLSTHQVVTFFDHLPTVAQAFKSINNFLQQEAYVHVPTIF